MAKICLFNSRQSADTAGKPFSGTLNQDSAVPSFSKPLRLFGGEGETRYCTMELLFTGNAAQTVVLNFWFEFWGDNIPASLHTPPVLRDLVDLDPAVGWAREVTEEVGASGAVTHNFIVRTITLTVPAGGVGVAAWLPVLIHAPWMRVRMYSTSPLGSGAAVRLLAHVGGHDEDEYLDTIDDIPYAYNAAAPA